MGEYQELTSHVIEFTRPAGELLLSEPLYILLLERLVVSYPLTIESIELFWLLRRITCFHISLYLTGYEPGVVTNANLAVATSLSLFYGSPSPFLLHEQPYGPEQSIPSDMASITPGKHEKYSSK